MREVTEKNKGGHILGITQWTFWYCNDIGVTSPSISVWHCWYIVNETHYDVNLRYQLGIKISRLDQSNFNVVMTSSRKRTLCSRKKSSKIVHLFSISHNNATFILWQLKNQSFRQLFFSCCYEKYVFFSKTTLLYLKLFLIL